MSLTPSKTAPSSSDSRVVVVGLGGATCSGKTTLAKHLLRILRAGTSSDSCIRTAFILHQDDFAPPESTLPVDSKYGVADWDRPDTAIDYARMHRTIIHIKQNATFPPGFSSHDELNSQPDCPISTAVLDKWTGAFASLGATAPSEEDLTIVLADGFLLYYDPAVRSSMDIKIFLRTSRDVLRLRREQREGYATAEGTVWKDPEGYFDNIVWPAYQIAHERVFRDGDLDGGEVVRQAEQIPSAGGPVPDLLVLDSLAANSDASTTHSSEMTALVDRTCKALWQYLTTQ